MAATAPRLDLYVPGLQPRDAWSDDGSGFSAPLWTWPEVDPSHPLADFLAGRFEGPVDAPTAPDCRDDDPDRQALALLGGVVPAEVDALTRATGDWGLAGGDRGGFGEQLRDWQAAGFTRLLCFDPVHLKAETDHAITLGPRFLGLDAETIDPLLEAMNAWLAADEMRVERIGTQLYLLARPTPGGVGPAHRDLERAGAPLACLLNRNAGVFLDEEHSEPRLRQWLTEVQMWLYPQPFNDARAAWGEPILNSFWPHGMTEIDVPPTPEDAPATLRLSDSPAVLARHDAVAWTDASVAAVSAALAAGQSVEVVLTEPAWCRLEGDLGGFQRELARVEAWLSDLAGRQGRFRLGLHDGHGGHWRRESSLARLWWRLRGGRRRRS